MRPGRHSASVFLAISIALSLCAGYAGTARADQEVSENALWREIKKGELSGFVAGDVRAFFESAPFEGQDTNALNPSIVLQPEYRYEWNDGSDRVAFVPFWRGDWDDRRRRHWDIREANYLHASSWWDVRFGVGKVYWGVAESRHLVDIVNQTDSIEDFDGEDKLGQPMLKVGLFSDLGTLDLFFLPRFRERTFPGRRGRLRFSIPVDTDAAAYESSAEEWHPDGALRWSHFIGPLDIGLSHFSGTSREPRFFLRVTPEGEPQLFPRYDIIHQTSLDVQATLESWLLKLEVMTRAGHGDRFAALVAGFEYTLYGILGTAADLGLLAEYLYDGRDAAIVPTGAAAAAGIPLGSVPPSALPPELFTERGLSLGNAPPTVLEDDVFGGMRITLNDVQSTDFLAGVIVDVENQTTTFTVETSRRFGDRWRVELEARIFANVDATDLLFAVRDDDHLQLRIARYF